MTAFAALAVSCSGSVGAPGAPTPAGIGAGKSGGDKTGTGGAAGTANCQVPAAPVLHARLLTPSQYDNTLLDLVKVGGDPSKDFSGGVDTQLDDLSVELRANAAADVAHQAALNLAQWSPCAPPQVAAAACEDQIIDTIGARAYRRPLVDSEHADLRALFDAGVQEKDFATGVEWFLAGVFQSPDFSCTSSPSRSRARCPARSRRCRPTKWPAAWRCLFGIPLPTTRSLPRRRAIN
jgi:hypothetical protein